MLQPYRNSSPLLRTKLSRPPNLVLLLLSLLLLCLTLPGCQTKLDPAGAYGGDVWLFRLDETAKTSYDFLHTFVTWELNNRDEIQKVAPAITQQADMVRDNAPKWWQETMAARGAYVQARQILGSTNNAAAVTSSILEEARQRFLTSVVVLQSTANNSSATALTSNLPNAPNLKKPLAAPTL